MIDGNIIVDEVSTLNLYLADSSTFTGSINSSGAAVEANVSESSGHSGGEKPDGEPPSGGKPGSE